VTFPGIDQITLVLTWLQPTGENGATRVPILIDLQRDEKGGKRGLAIQVDGRVQSVSASKIREQLIIFS
jgi:hypothetical protein